MGQIQCVSESCDHPIRMGQDFCPRCGTDNRPPLIRPKISSCQHRFDDPAANFCSRCGAALSEALAPNWFWTPTGIACSIGGLICGLTIVSAWMAMTPGSILGMTDYGKWSRVSYTVRGPRSTFGARGRRDTSNGAQIILYSGMAGVALFLIGYKSKEKFDNGGRYTD